MVTKNTKLILWYKAGVFSPATIKEAIEKGYTLRDSRYFNEDSLLEKCDAVLGDKLAVERYREKGVRIIDELVEKQTRRGRKPKEETETNEAL